MIQIKPGPELDRAVAEAADPWCSVGMCASSGCINIPASECGDTAETDPDVLAVWKWGGERNWQTLPKFSTDLNAAFEAAEKVGLFAYGRTNEHCWLALVQVTDRETRETSWRLQKHADGGDWDWYGDGAPTPALAICAAILKLKEDQ